MEYHIEIWKHEGDSLCYWRMKELLYAFILTLFPGTVLLHISISFLVNFCRIFF